MIETNQSRPRCRPGPVARTVLLSMVVFLATAATPGITSAAVLSLGRVRLPQRDSCTDVVVNGDFERGVNNLAPWVSKGFGVVSDHRVHGGSFAFWLGGYRDANDALSQLVSIPQSATVTLRYWWNMHSLDDEVTAHDHLVVSLRAAPGGDVIATLDTLDNTADRDTWTQASFELSAFSGMSVVVQLNCLGDDQNVTSFFIDDVQLEACGGDATPTATPTDAAPQKCFLPLLWHDGFA